MFSLKTLSAIKGTSNTAESVHVLKLINLVVNSVKSKVTGQFITYNKIRVCDRHKQFISRSELQQWTQWTAVTCVVCFSIRTRCQLSFLHYCPWTMWCKPNVFSWDFMREDETLFSATCWRFHTQMAVHKVDSIFTNLETGFVSECDSTSYKSCGWRFSPTAKSVVIITCI